MTRRAHSRRRPGATTAALAAALTLSGGCGRQAPPPPSSGCGWVYTVTLPDGGQRVLGACSGGFDADAAPTVRISPGQLLRVRVTTSLGKPVIRLPTVNASGALTVATVTRTILTLLATRPGRSVLAAHTISCSRPGRGSVPSCPVLRVAVD